LVIVLNLPLPPSVNSYRTIFRNRMGISKAGKDFKAQVSDYVNEYRVPKLGAARLEMKVVLYPRDKRKQDIDNRIKALWDALGDAGVFDDDEQIDILLIERGEIKKGGGCLVCIEILDKIEENALIT
jgi:crossover junction endodeoxyribonuclease RusA